MVRKFGLVAACLAAGLFVVSGLNAAEEKTPTVEDIMKKVPNKGRNKGLCAKCVDAATAGTWDECQKMAAELKMLGEAMGKNDPPKGSKESWAKQTKMFADNMAAMEKGAKAKDADAVKAAFAAFGKSCMGCHSQHRP